MFNIFDKSQLKDLYKPSKASKGEDNGQVTIIGGSSLFHGAPILALKSASRIVDMVFFATPEKSVGHVAENLKNKLLSFIWVPWEDVEKYIAKSDAILIGSGFMRFASEKSTHSERYNICDETCEETKLITERLLRKFPNKKWVIDAGSLQVIEPGILPKDCIITPNQKEFNLLFKINISNSNKITEAVQEKAREYKCIVVLKGQETIVASPKTCVIVKGGNPGMTKGGTGDVHAGLTVALLAKNNSFLAASAASYIIKAAGDTLFEKMGIYFNADDLTEQISITFSTLLK